MMQPRAVCAAAQCRMSAGAGAEGALGEQAWGLYRSKPAHLFRSNAERQVAHIDDPVHLGRQPRLAACSCRSHLCGILLRSRPGALPFRGAHAGSVDCCKWQICTLVELQDSRKVEALRQSDFAAATAAAPVRPDARHAIRDDHREITRQDLNTSKSRK